MNYDDFRLAIREAEQTMRSADQRADEFARLLRGRLRKVSNYVLVELKRELQAFNAHTKTWRD